MQSIPDRTFAFSLTIINLVNSLQKSTAANTIANQIIRSGTSIGANVAEAQSSPTKKDFIRGMTIALKESRETVYWLKLIREAKLAQFDIINKLIEENEAIVRILISSVKKAKLSTP